MLDILLEKREKYVSALAEAQNEDYSEQIEKELETYKKQLLERVEISKRVKMEKIGHYLEIIDDLLEEVSKKDENLEENKPEEEE